MVSLGSDAPVATPSPFSGMHAAITRTNDALEPKGGFCMENALTPEEALTGYTIWGAYAIFAEDKRGSLEVGKYAYFVLHVLCFVLTLVMMELSASSVKEETQKEAPGSCDPGASIWRKNE